MPKPALHIMFGPLAGETLREILAGRGEADRVAILQDDFGFGPIACDAAARARRIEAVLGVDDGDDGDVVARNAAFLAQTCADDVLPIAWLSRRSALCHANFLWWLSHLGDRPCRIVDVTELMLTVPARGSEPSYRYLVGSPSLLNAEQLCDLLGSDVPLGDAERAGYLERWRRLQAEDAPLRVVDAQCNLVSAPIEYFDALLLGFATAEWRGMTRIIADALVQFMDDDLYQTGDLVLHVRLRALVEAGRLEGRGDLSHMRLCELRLPPVIPAGGTGEGF
jgi:hypothetical protein